MATRGEQARAAAQRSGGRRQGKKASGPPERAKGTSRPQNVSRGRKATFALESTLPSQPASRKSSRRSANHQKAGSQLKARQLLKMSSPEQRHGEQHGRRRMAPR